MQSPLAKSALKALVYADIFSFPLTLNEIHHRLVSDPQNNEDITIITGTDISSLQKTITAQLSGIVNQYEKYYVINTNPNHILNRKNNQQSSQDKQQRLQKVCRYLQSISTVQMVALTGSLAMNNAQTRDDIDLLIVTSPGTLWSTRFQVTVLLDALKLRRQPHHTIQQDKICLNLFLDKNALTVPLDKQDLYTAHEVIQAEPLFVRGNTYTKFLLDNRWVIEYLPNAWKARANQAQSMNTHNSTKFGDQLTRPLEPLAHKLQKFIMSYHHTTEHVTQTQAYFHPQDHRPRVMNEYYKRLKQFKLI